MTVLGRANEQSLRCGSGSSYLIRDAAVVVVSHADPDWTLDLIRGSPRCVVTLSIGTHLHILVDNACNTKRHKHTVIVQNCTVLLFNSGIFVCIFFFLEQ